MNKNALKTGIWMGLLATTLVPYSLHAQAPKTTAPVANAPEQKPLTDSEARAAFAKGATTLATTKMGTQEYSDAAQKQILLANTIAWNAFGKNDYEEAGNWFAKRFAIKRDKYASDLQYKTANGDSLVAKMASNVQQRKADVDAAKDPEKKKSAQAALQIVENIVLILKDTTLMDLAGLAIANNDEAAYLKYKQAELPIVQAQLDDLIKNNGKTDDINYKKNRVAKVLEDIAGTLGDLAQISDAERDFDQAFAIRQSLPATYYDRHLSENYNSRGLMYYYNVGDFEKSRHFYQLALTAFDADDALLKQDMLKPIPSSFQGDELKKYQETLSNYNDMAIASTAIVRGTALKNLGAISQALGDYKIAEEYYRNDLALMAALPKGGYINIYEFARGTITSSTLGYLADLHSEIGESDLAVKEATDVLAMERSDNNDAGIMNALQGMALILYRRNGPGDLEASKHYLEQALIFAITLQKPLQIAGFQSNLATLSERNGNLDDAEKYAKQSLTLCEKMDNSYQTAGSLDVLAEVYIKQGHPDLAAPLLDRATKLQTQYNLPLGREWTLDLQGQVLETQNNREGALAKYKEAIALVESARQTASSQKNFLAATNYSRLYDRIVALLIKMKRDKEAFDYTSRAKAKDIQNAVPLTSLRTANKPLQDKINTVNNLASEIHTAESQRANELSKPVVEQRPEVIQRLGKVIASTRKEFYHAADDIVKTNPHYEDLLKVNPTTLVAAQSKIPDGVVLIECDAQEDQLYTFLVTNKSLKVVKTPVKAVDLWNRIKAVRAQISSPDSTVRGAHLVRSIPRTTVETANASENLTALYDILIAPIESEIADQKTIAFIPTKYLYYLPIQALAKRVNGELHYLIEDKQITYLAAADVLKAMDAPDASDLGTGMVAFGDPTGADLPFAKQEVNSIGKVYPQTEVFTGAQATKAQILDPKNWNKRILHFATHGILDANTPEKSYILMAGTKDSDASQLTVPDIYDMELDKVDLVTISACETALGDDQPGSEVLSLANAFDRARAHTVIASLWSVADDSTSALMIEFYRQLASGKSKAESLQAAQIKVLSDPRFKEPFYWAPFILMGDWR